MADVTTLPPLEPLPPVRVERIELVTIRLPLATPLRTAAGAQHHRDVLLLHVRATEAEGWAECAVEPSPTYSPEFSEAARLVLTDHLVPLAWAGPTGDALALGRHLGAVRGHPMARAAVELAVLDAQLRAAGRSLASWLGATATTVPAGAALGLHADPADLLAEADAALAAGAARLRVKVAPGSASAPLAELRAHVGADVLLQADANGTFALDDPAHLSELHRLDEVGLACLEQPLAPDDLMGHARLAEQLATPICLDEPLTSLAAVESAIALGACAVVCLKPARVGGWIAARAVHDRCVELGVPMWVGGMLETGIGRAANAAAAALPGMTLPPDLDPRGRFDPDLADPLRPVDGLVAVPGGPGTGAVPDPTRLGDAEVVSIGP
jgi:O-succinylbenzoate synthase